jgi:hypothetical protein
LPKTKTNTKAEASPKSLVTAEIEPLCSCDRREFAHAHSKECKDWIYSFFQEPVRPKIKVRLDLSKYGGLKK